VVTGGVSAGVSPGVSGCASCRWARFHRSMLAALLGQPGGLGGHARRGVFPFPGVPVISGLSAMAEHQMGGTTAATFRSLQMCSTYPSMPQAGNGKTAPEDGALLCLP